VIRQSKKRRDAKTPLAFEITAKDIKCADRCDAERCAIAEAVARIPDVSSVQISNYVADVRFRDGSWKRYVIEKRLRSAIKTFDEGGSFEDYAPPGIYQLAAPPPSQTLTGMRKQRLKETRSRPAGKTTGARTKHQLSTKHELSKRNQFARAQAERVRTG